MGCRLWEQKFDKEMYRYGLTLSTAIVTFQKQNSNDGRAR